MRISIVFFLLLAQSLYTLAQTNAQKQLQELYEAYEMRGASLSCYAVDLTNDSILLETIPQLNIVPASTMKLLTTASALHILGDDYTFQTKLMYSGTIDDDSLLNGDLLIVGKGDPALLSHYFEEHYSSFWDEFAGALKQKGINKIDGDIFYDSSIFDDEPVPATWVWEDIGNYYGAGASGLSMSDNMYKIYLSSPKSVGRPTKITKITPNIPNLKVYNKVLSSDIMRDRAYVYGSPYSNKRVIKGTIPRGQKEFEIKASIPNPPLFAANELKKALTERGIDSNNCELHSVTNPGGNWKIATHFNSPHLSEIINITNSESVNLFAEHLIKMIGRYDQGDGSIKAGVEAIKSLWEKVGIEMTDLYMVDGSGLSRFNSISAKQLTQVLSKMHDSLDVGDHFINSLSQPKHQGTLKDRFRNLADGQKIYAKTGSMTRVRAISGYLVEEKRVVAFTILVNNYSGSSKWIEDRIDQIVSAL